MLYEKYLPLFTWHVVEITHMTQHYKMFLQCFPLKKKNKTLTEYIQHARHCARVGAFVTYSSVNVNYLLTEWESHFLK